MTVDSYLDYVKLATKRRLRKLKEIVEARSLSVLLLFEGDPIVYKIALTNHFNTVLVFHENIYVLTDPTLYHEALSESPLDVILVENFTLEELAKKALSLLKEYEEHGVFRKPVIGVNKAWGRTRLSFLNINLLEVLHSQGVEIIDATELLAAVLNKPFDEELLIIRWISDATSQTLQAVRRL